MHSYLEPIRPAAPSRRAFLIFGALAAVGCGSSKDTPEAKKGVPQEILLKDSLEYGRSMQKQKKGR